MIPGFPESLLRKKTLLFLYKTGRLGEAERTQQECPVREIYHRHKGKNRETYLTQIVSSMGTIKLIRHFKSCSAVGRALPAKTTSDLFGRQCLSCRAGSATVSVVRMKANE